MEASKKRKNMLNFRKADWGNYQDARAQDVVSLKSEGVEKMGKAFRQAVLRASKLAIPCRRHPREHFFDFQRIERSDQRTR